MGGQMPGGKAQMQINQPEIPLTNAALSRLQLSRIFCTRPVKSSHLLQGCHRSTVSMLESHQHVHWSRQASPGYMDVAYPLHHQPLIVYCSPGP